MYTRKDSWIFQSGIGTPSLFVHGLEDYYLESLLFGTLLQSYKDVSKYEIKINKYITKV